jgi:hypothetical protein
VTDSLGEPVAARNLRATVWYAVIAAVALLAVLVGIVIYAILEERASTACGFTPPGREELPGSGWRADWEWWPPGFVCVYTDDRGRVVSRRRP